MASVSGSASLREILRTQTAASHESLDALFGTLDLGEREDFARFLSAHYIGLSALYPLYHAFVADELAMEPPPYPAMLRRDLAAMGRDAAHLPTISPGGDLDPLAVTYVLAGSRLGLTMLARKNYWGRRDARAAVYMDDTEGMAVWRSLLAKMAEPHPDAEAQARIVASANDAFAVFRHAFELSAAEARS